MNDLVKKFRRRFIFITMASLILLLATIMLVINIINFSSVTKTADSTLSYLMDNNGRFPIQNPLPPNQPDTTNSSLSITTENSSITIDSSTTSVSSETETTFSTTANVPSNRNRPDNQPPRPDNIDEERPYDTRYFYVTFVNGEVKDVFIDKISAIDRTSAISIATTVYGTNKEKGYTETVYRYRRKDNPEDTMIIFMDNSRQLEPTKNFFYYSLIIAGIGIVISFVIVFFVSKKVVKPLIISQEKQKRFITDAGHELKTPLTIISANNELLELEFGENEESKVINKQVLRMTDMVKNLTTLAKLDETQQVEYKDFSLSDALLDTMDNFFTAYQKEKKTLTKDIQENIIIKANEGDIRKIFSILLDNALKYSLTYTKVTLKKEKDKAVFLISNDATDIKEGDLSHVFERFYRSDTARGSTIEGSGIGLSIASQLAQNNRLKISAYGEKGSIFTIRIIF